MVCYHIKVACNIKIRYIINSAAGAYLKVHYFASNRVTKYHICCSISKQPSKQVVPDARFKFWANHHKLKLITSVLTIHTIGNNDSNMNYEDKPNTLNTIFKKTVTRKM